MLQYIKEHASEFADAKNDVDFIFNMAPHQSNKIDGPNGANSYSIDHMTDILSGNDMGNQKAAFTTNEKGVLSSHQNGSFAHDLKAFTSSYVNSKGDSKNLIKNFKTSMKGNYGIEVKVR